MEACQPGCQHCIAMAPAVPINPCLAVGRAGQLCLIPAHGLLRHVPMQHDRLDPKGKSASAVPLKA